MSTAPLVPSSEKIGKRLKDLIMNDRQGLRKMYGETEDELNRNLEAPIQRGEEMARKLITEMGCIPEIAKDLTVLTLYNVAILIGMFRCEGARVYSLGLVLLIFGWMDGRLRFYDKRGKWREKEDPDTVH